MTKPDTDPRLCKDCRHAIPPESKLHLWVCDHPSSIVPAAIDIVTGKMSDARKMSCQQARGSIYDGRCGYVAAFFEAHEPGRDEPF